MDPFTVGILVTCGLIAINVMVAVSVEKSHHRALAGVEHKSGGSSILANTENESDDPTRGLIRPRDNIRNYTDLQNSSDIHLQTIENDKGLPYTISSYENPPNINMSSTTESDHIAAVTNSSQNSTQSDTTPQDTTHDDTSPSNSTQSNTTTHKIAGSEPHPE